MRNLAFSALLALGTLLLPNAAFAQATDQTATPAPYATATANPMDSTAPMETATPFNEGQPATPVTPAAPAPWGLVGLLGLLGLIGLRGRSTTL